MKNSTLCYIENGNDEYLMLHRTKKKNDENKDKYVGIGGKFEDKESPFDCIKREIKEETGLTATKLLYRGIITFVSDEYETEYMHLFTCNEYFGKLTDCDEGELLWVKKDKIYELSLWEGDKIFFKLLEQDIPFFSLKLVYEKNKLIYHEKEI